MKTYHNQRSNANTNWRIPPQVVFLDGDGCPPGTWQKVAAVVDAVREAQAPGLILPAGHSLLRNRIVKLALLCGLIVGETDGQQVILQAPTMKARAA